VVDEDHSDEDSDLEEDAKDSDYDYLLGMAMWSLTAEKKEELLKKKDDKHKELDEVLNHFCRLHAKDIKITFSLKFLTTCEQSKQGEKNIT
jgi:hypothetical protein